MAAPIGPIAILTIRRSLAEGHYAGIATALGVALADGFYAAVAAFGLSAISTFLITQQKMLYCLGGLMLIYLGISAFRTVPGSLEKPLKSTGFLKTLLQTTALTLTNPMTILTFIAAFAAFGLVGHQDFYEATLLCFGVFCGSGFWFVSLSLLIAHFRHRVTPYMFMLVNKISGALLVLIGIFFIISAINTMMA